MCCWMGDRILTSAMAWGGILGRASILQERCGGAGVSRSTRWASRCEAGWRLARSRRWDEMGSSEGAADGGEATHHSCGGMTLTMPERRPQWSTRFMYPCGKEGGRPSARAGQCLALVDKISRGRGGGARSASRGAHAPPSDVGPRARVTHLKVDELLLTDGRRARSAPGQGRLARGGGSRRTHLHRRLEDRDAALALLVLLWVEVELAVGVEPAARVLRPRAGSSGRPARVHVVVGRDGVRRRVEEGRLDVPRGVVEVELGGRRRRPGGRRLARAGRGRQTRLKQSRRRRRAEKASQQVRWRWGPRRGVLWPQ